MERYIKLKEELWSKCGYVDVEGGGGIGILAVLPRMSRMSR